MGKLVHHIEEIHNLLIQNLLSPKRYRLLVSAVHRLIVGPPREHYEACRQENSQLNFLRDPSSQPDIISKCFFSPEREIIEAFFIVYQKTLHFVRDKLFNYCDMASLMLKR